MHSIARALTVAGEWLWQHKAWTILGTVGSAMSLYKFIVDRINRGFDAKLYRAINQRGIVSVEQAGIEVDSANLRRIESRLWSMTEDRKIGHSQTVDGEDRWYPLPQQSDPPRG